MDMMTRLRTMNALTWLLVLAIGLPIAWTFVEGGLALQGNRSPEWRTRVLRHFTPEDIERGTEYRNSFIPGSLLSRLIFWGILGFLVLGGGGRWLADRAAAVTGGRWFLTLLLVAIAVALLLRLARFPISVYHGYVLEGHFGFRRLDFGAWLIRLLKAWAVGGGIEVAIVVALFLIIRRFPDRWLPLALAGGTVLSFVFTIAWQAILLPIFYQVSPLPAGPLRDGVTELAERAGVPVEEIQVIDQSRVSAHTNAFFTGIGKHREIYLYDTLSEQHEVPEVLAIVAHEIGHWRHQHVLKGWALGVVAMGIGLGLLALLLRSPGFLAAAGARGPADPVLVPVLLVLVTAATIATEPITNAISRHYERQSDRAAVELTGDPETFVKMKIEGARANRSNLLPNPLLVFWNATHPPVIERIEMAAAAVRAGGGGPVGQSSSP
jgi:STE24 endopeptidase